MEFLLVFIFVFFICVLFYSIQRLQNAWYFWLTLGFLPMGLHIRKGTNIHSWRIPILGAILNYITACLVNLIDAWIWFWLWLPGLKKLTLFLYRSPDMLERYLSLFLGGQNGHRNFVSHSVFNPIFLIIVWLFNQLLNWVTVPILQIPIQIIASVLCLAFIAHLLADTLPKAWLGKSLIKVFFIFHFTTFSISFSKFWLHLHAGLCFIVFTYYLNIFSYF